MAVDAAQKTKAAGRRVWDLEEAVSNILKVRGITHYTIPFKDRPDICILHKGNDITVRKEHLDEH